MASLPFLLRSSHAASIASRAAIPSLHSTQLHVWRNSISSCSSLVRHAALCSSSSHRRFSSLAPASPEAEEKKEVSPVNQAEISHFLSSLPVDLSEHATKFTSWPHLLNASSRSLKALGLSIKHRKLLLRHCERYREKMRRAEMSQFIATTGHTLTPRDLQQALYDIAYAHVYARQWRRAEEREAQHWWRQSTLMARLRKKWVRNQWNGVHVQTNPPSMKPLRNPEAMKARLEAELQHLKSQQERGIAKRLDHLALIEDSQLDDENWELLVQDILEDRKKEMMEDEDVRSWVREELLKPEDDAELELKTDGEDEKEVDTKTSEAKAAEEEGEMGKQDAKAKEGMEGKQREQNSVAVKQKEEDKRQKEADEDDEEKDDKNGKDVDAADAAEFDDKEFGLETVDELGPEELEATAVEGNVSEFLASTTLDSVLRHHIRNELMEYNLQQDWEEEHEPLRPKRVDDGKEAEEASAEREKRLTDEKLDRMDIIAREVLTGEGMETVGDEPDDLLLPVLERVAGERERIAAEVKWRAQQREMREKSIAEGNAVTDADEVEDKRDPIVRKLEEKRVLKESLDKLFAPKRKKGSSQ